MLSSRLGTRTAGRRQRGQSLVEIMVGVAVGLFVVAGSMSVFVSSIAANRRLTVEARVNQDLRAAADIVARDLRRGGYWENAIAGTVRPANGAAVTANPNALVSADAANSTITYSVARDTSAARCSAIPCTDNTLDNDEQSGFRLSSGVLQMLVGADNWQALTDPAVVTVNSFALTATETTIDIRDSCEKLCTGSGCPTIKVRSYLLQLHGTSAADSAVSRVLQERIRVRNDVTAGTCPA